MIDSLFGRLKCRKGRCRLGELMDLCLKRGDLGFGFDFGFGFGFDLGLLLSGLEGRRAARCSGRALLRWGCSFVLLGWALRFVPGRKL